MTMVIMKMMVVGRERSDEQIEGAVYFLLNRWRLFCNCHSLALRPTDALCANCASSHRSPARRRRCAVLGHGAAAAAAAAAAATTTTTTTTAVAVALHTQPMQQTKVVCVWQRRADGPTDGRTDRLAHLTETSAATRTSLADTVIRAAS